MSAILKTVINRFYTSQRFALQAGQYAQSLDRATWDALQTAGAGESFADVGHSADRGYMLVGDGGAGTPLARDSDGVDQDFSGAGTIADLVAVAPRIQGGYFAYDSAGRTFACEKGSTAWTARTALPAGGTVQARGLWRDGAIADLLYFAKGAGGVYKSLDGFGSSGGFYLVRKPGVGSSPAGAVYTMVGADGLLSTAKITTTTVASAVGSGAGLYLWTGAANSAPAANWFDASFDHSGWAAIIASTNVALGAPAALAGSAWVTVNNSSALPATAEWLFFESFSLPAGAIASATLTVQFDDYCRGVWINSHQVVPPDAAFSGPGTTSTVTVDPAILLPGATNTIAIWDRNDLRYIAVDWKLVVTG